MKDDIPLVQKKKPTVGDYVRSGSCIGEPQTNALQCLHNKDLTIFTDLVNVSTDEESNGDFPQPSDHWINKPLPEEDDKTLLGVAIENRLYDFIQVLLQAGASASLFNLDLGRAPVHDAATAGDGRIMAMLFKMERNKADVNALVKASGRTALHICAEAGYEDCANCLLRQPGVDVGVKDKKGKQTPLYLAAKKENESIARKLISHGASVNDVCFGKLVADVIAEKFPKLDMNGIPKAIAPLAKQFSQATQDRLITLMDTVSLDGAPSDAQLDEFKSLVMQADSNTLNTVRCGGYTLLQRACDGGISDFVECLLREGGVDPNGFTDTASIPPLLLAANHGYSKVIDLLQESKADFTALDEETSESVLHRLLKRGNAKKKGFVESLEIILESDSIAKDVQRIVNRRDVNKQTALHYATQMWPQHIVRRLLEVGANIGMKNQWDEVPITNILPSTMEAFLDEFCLTSKGDVNHENFEITFNYSFLAPPKEDLPAETLDLGPEDAESQKLSGGSGEQKLALPETQSLWYMGRSKEHRHLLKHPVITSFLYLKWARIRRFFNRNVRFYLLFVFILTWFIFENFGGSDTVCRDGITTNPLLHGLFIVFSVVVMVFIFRDWIMDIKDFMRAEAMKKTNPDGAVETLSPGKVCFIVVLSNWVEVLLIAGLLAIISTGADYLWWVLGILLIILIVREFFQVTVSLKRYVFSPENWMEVSMIILISIILLYNPKVCTDAYDLKRCLASFAIVLSWAELITLVGKHPKLTQYNIYVTMFYKVMGTFFFFLSWYAFFIVAFGLGFYIMLHKQPDDVGEDDYIFFNSPWLALVKTSTMFVGELEFSDVPVGLESKLAILGYLFFLSFVFLIVVVLMNLLNGLAVSDTGIIQEKAEIVSYISRVETISYTESVLLGDPFNFLSNWPALKWIITLPSCSICAQIYRNKTMKRILHKITGATGILLFYSFLPTKKLTLLPNDKKSDCSCLTVKAMEHDIISATKAVVLRKSAEEQSEHVETRLKSLEEKIDLILQKLM